MPDSETHISIVTMASKSDSESMDYTSVMEVGHQLKCPLQEVALRVFHCYKNAVKEDENQSEKEAASTMLHATVIDKEKGAGGEVDSKS